jgi:hypothetical protein
VRLRKVQSDALKGGQIAPSFMNREKKEIREAKMELNGKLLFVWADSELVGQCHVDHPALVRHMNQLESIFDVVIINKDWMIREVTVYGEEKETGSSA